MPSTLRLIGTSHIAKASLNDIRNAFSQLPDVVCVELDLQRLHALLSKQPRTLKLRAISKIGVKGFLFAALGQWAQNKLGKIAGLEPGADMLEAIHLAHRHQLPLVCIDRSLAVTLKRLSQSITFKEKIRFLKDILIGPFSKKQRIQISLNEVPEKDLITKVMEELRHRYPSLYRVLVQERDQYMAKKLLRIQRQNPDKNLLAVVGAGHEKGIRHYLAAYQQNTKYDIV